MLVGVSGLEVGYEGERSKRTHLLGMVLDGSDACDRRN
jgi:hypothetical protein